MGMDVTGTNADSEAGKYFAANIWTWSPIHDLICRLCSDLIDEDTLRLLAYNEGAGPRDAQVCKEMANRFEVWMEHNVDGNEMEADAAIAKVSVHLEMCDKLGQPRQKHSVSDHQLKEWIEFLRHCGGFAVW